jgi:uncharacterized membrane protein YfcA
MTWISLLFGAVVGLSLGLTGGGGAIFAVPLLVYGVGISPREAVGISLAAVGATALVGFLFRWRTGQVEISTGLLFAFAGMLGAPLGALMASHLPEQLLLMLFGGLMLLVAARLWRKSGETVHSVVPPTAEVSETGPACQRDESGMLMLTTRCSGLLLFLGMLSGVLAGLFGVGGGFVIVPALVLFSGMSIHRAIGTSLLVIALTSVSGVASHLWAGRDLPLDTTLLFIAGGIVGMFAGIGASRYLSGPALQKVFAVAIVAVAIFVILRTTVYF